jgi:transcriptional regulator with XRE-family HTH domain
MNDTFGSRVEAVLDDKQLKKSEFCKLTGFSHVTLSNIINGKTLLPSISILYAIGEAFPEIDLNWVVTGRGKMYLPAGMVMGEVPQEELEKLPTDTGAKAQEMIEIQRKLLETQEKLNELMERDNARLIQAMKEKDPEQAKRLGF